MPCTRVFSLSIAVSATSAGVIIEQARSPFLRDGDLAGHVTIGGRDPASEPFHKAQSKAISLPPLTSRSGK